MSSSDEKAPPRKGLGWFPKLLLWAAVIAFGYVYLSSVDREDGGIREGSLLDSLAKLSPVSLDALPGFSSKGEQASTAQPQTQTGPVAAKQGDQPVAKGESAKTEASKPAALAEPAKPAASSEAIAESGTKTQVAETPASQPRLQPPPSYEALAVRPTPKPAEKPAAVAAPPPAATAAQAPPAAAPQAPAGGSTVPAVPKSEPVATAVSTAPAASAPAPGPQAGSQAPASAQQAPTSGQGPFGQPPAVATPRDDWASMQQKRHTEMMARYEAMRREAEERMRRYWDERREAMPPAPLYGYPGYMPGYWPGYGPGFYGPPR